MAKRLRVLMINDYSSLSGGAELQMHALSRHLSRRGHKVRMLSSDVALAEGFEPTADRLCKGFNGRRQVLGQTANFSALKALRRELSDYPPDVVHIRMFLWQLSPPLLPALRDIPVLFQAAVYKAICPNGMKILPDGSQCTKSAGMVCLSSNCVAPLTWLSTMAQLAMIRRWRKNIDCVATLSSRMATLFEQEGWKDVHVIPNGIDETPRRPPLRDPPTVAYAGRLSREKGLNTLLDAFSIMALRVPQARLLIAGDGPLEEELRRRATASGQRVEFLGHLDRETLEHKFGAAWVQVVPSLWQEPFGNVSLEAMMRGTAVIASDVGGQSDIVRNAETGFLVPPGDADALASRLLEILEDRLLAESLGAAGREVALASHNRTAIVDQLERIYWRLIAERQ